MNLADAKRIVVKIGTESITSDGSINYFLIRKIAKEIAALIKKGKKITIVTSGAIACGRRKTGEKKEGNEVEKQRYAAIGQPFLMMAYIKSLDKYGLNAAQFLVTFNDFDNKWGKLKKVYEKILKKGAIPIFNENDVIATEEITFGDNDILAAYVTKELDNDLFLILTTKNGLYKKGKIINIAESYERKDYDFLPSSREGRGGIKSKLEAAEIVNKAGKPCIISNINFEIKKIIEGKVPRTLFLPQRKI